jgi:hypothetical protein
MIILKPWEVDLLKGGVLLNRDVLAVQQVLKRQLPQPAVAPQYQPMVDDLEPREVDDRQ